LQNLRNILKLLVYLNMIVRLVTQLLHPFLLSTILITGISLLLLRIIHVVTRCDYYCY